MDASDNKNTFHRHHCGLRVAAADGGYQIHREQRWPGSPSRAERRPREIAAADRIGVRPTSWILAKRPTGSRRVAKAVLNEPEEGVAARVSHALADSRLLRMAAERPGHELLLLPNGFFALF